MFAFILMRRKGFFITFEGIDGSGKTTQLKLTEEYLSEQNLQTIVLREPGSTPLSEKIRDILLCKEIEINAISELMLYLAARAELTESIIAPSLKNGEIILCDRFFDSTIAYQGYGRGIDINLVRKLNSLAVGEIIPDLTFIIDINYTTSLKRRKKTSDRLESESKGFFNRVHHGFQEIARREKQRVVVVDGTKPADEVFEEIKDCLKRKLKNN